MTTVAEDHRSADPEEIVLLRQSVRDMLAALYSGDSGHSGLPDEDWAESWPQTWQALTDQGVWSTLEAPEGSLLAAATVAEELGRALYPGPGCETLAANWLLGRLGQTGPGALVTGTGDGSSEVEVDPMVAVAPGTRLLIAAGDTLLTAPVDAARPEDLPDLDLSRRLVRLSVADLQPVPAEPDVVQQARAARTLLYCADTLGCVDRVLTKTVEYAAERHTFGRPIGQYQAVAHRLVDHAVTLRQLRLLLESAVAAFDRGTADLAERVATVRTYFWGRGTEIVSDCIQLCGGIGFTWEWGHHFAVRRTVQNDALAAGPGRPHRAVARYLEGSGATSGPLDEYRSQARDFIAANAPAGQWYDGIRVPRDGDTERAVRQWYADLFQAGYMGGSWPLEFGGRPDHRPEHDAVVMEEIVRARCPRPIDQVMLAAHLLISFGTPEQKNRYLSRIRSAQDIWCQLLSEPGVGSDLARLSTRATRLPDGSFRVDGQKVWTTDGQWSQMGVLLARTDPEAAKPHAGLTMFVVDMATPGIEVRPIREMTGSAEFCEVYFDGAVLPADAVLGELNQGWAVANSGLASERAYVGANAVMLELLFADLIELARAVHLPDGTALDDPVVREELADLYCRVAAVQAIARDAVAKVTAGADAPADGMIAKLLYTELNVALCRYAVRLAASGRLGEGGAAVYRRWQQAFLWSRALTISGGSSEIIHNVLATQLLGLPRSW